MEGERIWDILFYKEQNNSEGVKFGNNKNKI